jgi:membrane-bound serine protease (ClpP class)
MSVFSKSVAAGLIKTGGRCQGRRPLTLLSLILLFLLLVSLGASLPTASAENNSGPVIIANFNASVDPGSAMFMSRVVSDAKNQGASAIIIELNTPGGLLSDMLSIISSIDDANQSDIPTYTYIVPNGLGASAGSYIAMATSRIIMGPGSVIGPSTPIVVGGSELEENHTEAAMLNLMVSLAQKWGRNTVAADNMVVEDEAFTANEAVQNHVADGLAGSISDAIDNLGMSGKQQVTLSENFYEQLIGVLSNPILDGILILLGTVAVVLDIYHPTILLTVVGAMAIVAGLVGAEVVTASVLGFLILAIAAALIILELKLGHGFSMMAGVVLGALGIIYMAQGLEYSPSPITSTTEIELFVVVIIGIVASLYFRWVIGPIRSRSKLTGPEAIVGQVGVAVTDLKPKGEVRVGGVVWRAESITGRIMKGESVRVKSIKGLAVVVEKIHPDNSRSKNH